MGLEKSLTQRATFQLSWGIFDPDSSYCIQPLGAINALKISNAFSVVIAVRVGRVIFRNGQVDRVRKPSVTFHQILIKCATCKLSMENLEKLSQIHQDYRPLAFEPFRVLRRLHDKRAIILVDLA